MTFGFILKEKFGLFLQHNTQIKILDQLLDRVLDLIKKMEPSVKLTGLYFFFAEWHGYKTNKTIKLQLKNSFGKYHPVFPKDP